MAATGGRAGKAAVGRSSGSAGAGPSCADADGRDAAGGAARGPAGRRPPSRTFLEDISRDLTHAAALLSIYAESDSARREALSIAPATADQLAALIAARHARNAAFGLDLSNGGWSLLLELYRAHLAHLAAAPRAGPAQGACRPARLATDARLAMSTATRWLALLADAGLAERRSAGAGAGARAREGAAFALTPAGVEAMADYFTAARTGWNAG
jgi:hypothetical protein